MTHRYTRWDAEKGCPVEVEIPDSLLRPNSGNVNKNWVRSHVWQAALAFNLLVWLIFLHFIGVL